MNQPFLGLPGRDAIKTYPVEEWYKVTDAWAYASASTITVPPDATTLYQVGDTIRLKQGGGYKYYYITAVASSLLTVYAGSDYTVASSVITDIYVSRHSVPMGFPREFNWTPAFTNLTVGNGTLAGAFCLRGGLVYHHWTLQFGSTTSISGAVTYTPPINANSSYALAFTPITLVRLYSGGSGYQGTLNMNSVSSFGLVVGNVSATYATNTAISATIPATWTTSDQIECAGVYMV